MRQQNFWNGPTVGEEGNHIIYKRLQTQVNESSPSYLLGLFKFIWLISNSSHPQILGNHCKGILSCNYSRSFLPVQSLGLFLSAPQVWRWVVFVEMGKGKGRRNWSFFIFLPFFASSQRGRGLFSWARRELLLEPWAPWLLCTISNAGKTNTLGVIVQTNLK